MQPSLPPEYDSWTATFLVLTVGVAAIVGLTAIIGRLVRAAAWQRTVWQVCTLALFALLLMEWTGTGRGIVHSCTTAVPSATAVPAAHELDVRRASATAVPAVVDSDEPSFETSRPTVPGDDSRAANATAVHAPSTFAIQTQPAPNAAEAAVAQTPPTPRTGQTAAAHAASVAWWPAAVWALGTAGLFGRILWAGFRLRAFRRRAVPVGEAIERRVAALAGRLAFRRPVRVLAADGLCVPVAFGVVRPTLVIPAAFDADFDPPQQEAVLAHELAHLAAGDPAWHLLATWACALLWWHPLVWWMRRQLRAASEAAADEVSLVVHNGPSVLAECLVALGKRLARRPHLGWLSVDGNGFRSGLGRRVERLLQLRTRPWQSPRRGRTMLARCVLPVSLVFLAVSCTAWAQPQVPSSEGGTTMNVLRSSWRCSLAATALWAMLGPAQVSAAEDEKPRDKPRAAADAERPQPAAREGERRERPSPEAQMEQRRKLESMARDLHARLEQLKPDQDAEAKEIKQKLERVSNALRDMQGGRPERPNAEAAQRLEQMKRRIAELKEAGKHDEAERVAREAREIMQRLQAREGNRAQPGPEIAERLEQMKRRIAELKAAGKNDEAEAVGRELRATMQRLQGAGDRPRPNAEAAQRLEQMKRRIAELKEAGKHDEAARVAQELQQIMQRMQGAREGDPKGPHAEALERLEQLKRHAAELKAAGKHDEAMAVAREASELAQRLKAAREGAAGDRPRPAGDREAPRAGAPDREVQALRNEVQQLRREMQEMREMMKKLLERERK